MSQLPVDCLNEIFEYLEHENKALRSCILVNRSWCEVAVRILWSDVNDYCSLNIRTLIACLPNESKEILRNNEIIISAQTLSTVPVRRNVDREVVVKRKYHGDITEVLESNRGEASSGYIT